ncbi:alpha/beta-hydrolase [Thozetella sp. PMI_491]|nr:alpha/beta-hydrolase [Thozetella sp. PMI_491]
MVGSRFLALLLPIFWVLYREAGDRDAPTVLLLHGYPSSSIQFKYLIPLLADKYHVVAPDFPGFGFTDVPDTRNYTYTFDNLAATTEAFVDALGLTRYAMFIFDYGAPVGLRMAMRRPETVTAIVTQNGNAYEEGLGQTFWAPMMRYWASGSEADRDTLRKAVFTLERTKKRYLEGEADPSKMPPEFYYLDNALYNRPGNIEIQLDLIYDYRTNVALYPKFQQYFRDSRVPILAVWGKNDVGFIPPGAEAFARDAHIFELHFLDSGHFALLTNELVMAKYMKDFFHKHRVF